MNSGAFGENFPYSNFHDLNMDWIIKIAKDFLDQYSHIQETIANGEQSLQDLTTDGLQSLQNKASELETLLQEWYNTHSEDIANELASALSDINSELADAITAFDNSADAKAQQTIASIPDDYTAFYADALKNKVALPDNTDLNDVTGNNFYLLNAPGYTYTHSPLAPDVAGLLVNYEISDRVTIQVMYSITTNANCWIRSKIVTSWVDWTQVIIPEKFVGNGVLPDNTDLNDIVNQGTYFINSGHPYTHNPLPDNIGGTLIVLPGSITGAPIQIAIPYVAGSNSAMLAKYRMAINNTYSNTWIGFGLATIGLLADDTDIDTLKTPGCYFFNSGHDYIHAPFENWYGGTIIVFPESIPGCIVQVAMKYDLYDSHPVIKIRMSLNNTFPQTWFIVGGSSNTYSFNEYSNTYNISATPSITTDTNAYLAPTGTNADRTADIVTMLNTYGICRLGKGDYYVKNLKMPDVTSIVGTGVATRIILTNDGEFAISPGSACHIDHVAIYGATTNISPSATLGNRHGILWQGTYTLNQSAPTNSLISNVYIRNFTGGAITCYDTGYGTHNGLQVVNADIVLNGAGINISYWSEYNKFTNIKTFNNYYGCINNGGNNVFDNCDFSSCNIGMLMDNEQNQSPNNTHGSCIGCLFNHESVKGIQILNCHNGFIFSGCQIFDAQTEISESDGIVFNAVNMGMSNCNITITDGGCILYSNCMTQGNIPVTITNNPHVVFSNCYERSTGNAWHN